MAKLPITVIMLTLNEEHSLRGALENVRPWAEQVFIVDSLSTDDTVNIAFEHGAEIVQRPFTNFGDQWNFALRRLPIKTPWTLKLDPDERFTPELVDSIGGATLLDEADGYSFSRRLWFMGKPLRVRQDVLRLWKTGKCRFSDVLVNEHPIVDGVVRKLKGYLEHYDSPNLDHWMEKQNRYTTMEAIMHMRGDRLSAEPRFFGNRLERRMFLKKHFTSVPFRYGAYWLWLVFGKGVWTNGSTGLAWAHLRTEVLRMRGYKIREIKQTKRMLDIPTARCGTFDRRILDSELQKTVLPWSADSQSFAPDRR